MKKYEVSIVTPIHNTNLDIFTRTVQSMRDQTLGFENIEWVVVVHNSTEEYDRKIQELLGGYEQRCAHAFEFQKQRPGNSHRGLRGLSRRRRQVHA